MKLTGSQIFVEVLVEQGVDTLFGYPGGAVLNLYDELYKNSDRIRHVLTAHEQGASHAADGYARATGKVGVCMATSGPGATNLVTGIATANLDSIPMVAITCNVTTGLLGKDSFQEIDITGITMPITKYNFIVKNVNDLAKTIRKAFEIRKTAKLSQPALEVLTIIAYYQPTTRAYVDQVRGVDSSYTVGLLLERGLIEECGRLQVPGRPRLYRTTKKFLRDFHLGSLEELPEMPGLEADGQLRMTDDGTILDPGSLAAKEESPLTNEGR